MLYEKSEGIGPIYTNSNMERPTIIQNFNIRDVIYSLAVVEVILHSSSRITVSPLH
jgi:hypothetical protein